MEDKFKISLECMIDVIDPDRSMTGNESVSEIFTASRNFYSEELGSLSDKELRDYISTYLAHKR